MIYSYSKTFCIFVFKNVSSEQLMTVSNLFKISINEHSHNTRGTKIIKPTAKTTTYGLNSVKCRSVDD